MLRCDAIGLLRGELFPTKFSYQDGREILKSVLNAP